MPLQHAQGSVFTAPEGSCIVHACNAQGHWGAGIALAMRIRYPDALDVFCRQERKCGEAIVYMREAYRPRHIIASLVTSQHYGRRRDPPADIIRHTRIALRALLTQAANWWPVEFHSPKFNSGLFAVPWVATEAVLLDEINRVEGETQKRINWTVWTP